jgi:hypothetical protein
MSKNSSKTDVEMLIASRIMRLLGQLPADAQRRVLRYLADRYIAVVAAEPPTAQAQPKSDQDGVGKKVLFQHGERME